MEYEPVLNNPIVEILRLETMIPFGTFGMMRINKQLWCSTLEPGSRENKPDRSSIPTGQYLCSRKLSPKFGPTFEVLDVPGRSDILFHAGNVLEDTHGCILLAQYPGKLHGDRAVLNSGATFKAFMEIMRDVEIFHLTIQEVY
jgi:hypothetical protein